MKLTDSLNLASKKVKVRKTSSIFSGCLVAVGIFILASGAILLNSIQKRIDEAPKGIEYEKALVSLSQICNSQYEDAFSLDQQRIYQIQNVLATESSKLTQEQIKSYNEELTNLIEKVNNSASSCQNQTLDFTKFKSDNAKYEPVNMYNNEFYTTDQSKLGATIPDKDIVGAKSGVNFVTMNRNTGLGIEEYFDIDTKNNVAIIQKDSKLYNYLKDSNFHNEVNFENISNKSFYAKYEYSGYSLENSSDALNVIIPTNYLNYLDSKLMDYSLYINTSLPSTSPIQNIPELQKYIDLNENAKANWIGKTLTISLMNPAEVSYEKSTTKSNQMGLPINTEFEITTKYKLGADKLKIKIVGFDDTGSYIKYLTSEATKFPVLQTIQKNYLTQNKKYLIEFKNKDLKAQFLKVNGYEDQNQGFFGLSESSLSSMFNDKQITVGDYIYALKDQKSNYENISSAITAIKDYPVKYIGLAFLIISGIIMFLILSKAVTESTKEIAIFRSFGAKTFDIVSIYFLYTILIVGIGIILATILSYIAMLVLNQTPLKAMIEYGLFVVLGTYSNGNSLNFVSFPILELVKIYAVAILVGIVASIIPIIRAIRIQPIVAMRNE